MEIPGFWCRWVRYERSPKSEVAREICGVSGGGAESAAKRDTRFRVEFIIRRWLPLSLTAHGQPEFAPSRMEPSDRFSSVKLAMI